MGIKIYCKFGLERVMERQKSSISTAVEYYLGQIYWLLKMMSVNKFVVALFTFIIRLHLIEDMTPKLHD